MSDDINEIAKWYCEHEITATEYKENNDGQVEK